MRQFRCSRETIKYVAMFTMLLNHGSNIFFGYSGAPWAVVLRDAGYFTAPVMCFFLAEGFRYTRSVKKYALRLAVFALISQGPFYYALAVKGGHSDVGMNMMFTLLLCLGILAADTKIQDSRKRLFVIAALMAISIFSDWAVYAPIVTLCLYRAGDDRKQIRKIYGIFAIGYAAGAFAGDLESFPVSICMLDAAGSFLAVAAAGYVILHLYNGKQSGNGKWFGKWFFYCFYPLHLLILGLLCR